MAALDFPNSPTLNQQYAAPNGVTYQWDGAAWIVTGGPPGQLWTASGATLLPTDVTKTVSVPGGAAAAGTAMLLLGSNTARGRVTSDNAISPAWIALTTNRDPKAATQDDATKSSWQLALNSSADNFTVQRQAAGAGLTPFLTLDSTGHLSVKAMAAAINNNNVGQAIAATTWTTATLGTTGQDSSGGVMPLPGSSQLKSPTTGGWMLLASTCNWSAAAQTNYLAIQASPDGSTGWSTIAQAGATNSFTMTTAVLTYPATTQYYRVQGYSTTALTLAWCTLNGILIAGI
jgi:hypothetical protein